MKTVWRDVTSRHHFDSEEVVETWFAKKRILDLNTKIERIKMDTLWKYRSELLATVPAVLKRVDERKRAAARGQGELM